MLDDVKESKVEVQTPIYTLWRRDTALSYAVWRLTSSLHELSLREESIIRDYIAEQLLANMEDITEGLRTETLCHLPQGAITLLEHLNQKNFYYLRDDTLKKQLSSAVKYTRNAQRRGFHRPSAVKMLSLLILNTSISARLFCTFAQQWLSDGWKQLRSDAARLEQMDARFDFMRSTEMVGYRVHGPDLLMQDLEFDEKDFVWRDWSLIGREIVSSLFSWPLVISPSADALSGFYLPIIVDVDFDGQARTKCVGMQGLKNFDWGSALYRARHVSNVFWGNQHNRLTGHKWRTENASVYMDVSEAAHLLATVYRANVGKFIDVHEGRLGDIIGRSLEAYLVVSIIGRMIGLPSAPQAAVTGMIGEPVEEHLLPTAGPRNWEIAPVEGTAQKVRWAADSGRFSQIIIPKKSDVSVSHAGDQTSDLQILKSYDLLNAVDKVFGHRWRREKYVRCPEVAYIRQLLDSPYPIVLDAKTSLNQQVDRALGWLRRLEEHVAWAPTDISHVHIALAFRYLNSTWREESQVAPIAKRSICIVRLRNEQGERFLSTVMDAIGMPRSDVDELLRSSSLEKLQTALSEKLVRPRGGAGARWVGFPDLLVIVRPPAQKLRSAYKSNFFEMQQTLSPSLSRRIKLAESSYDLGPAVQRWRTAAGHARIVVVDDRDSKEVFSNPDFSGFDMNHGEWGVRCLATLCPGFGDRVAKEIVSAVLPNGLEDGVVEGFLNEIRQRNILISTFAGNCLNPRVKVGDTTVAEMWRAHLSAVFAYAPYLSERPRSAPADTDCLDLISVHEAQDHYGSFRRLYTKSRSTGFRDDVADKALSSNVSERLASVDCRSWSSLTYLARDIGKFDATPYVEEALGWSETVGFPSGIRLLGFIELALNVVLQIRTDARRSADVERYLGAIDVAIRLAIEHPGVDHERVSIFGKLDSIKQKYVTRLGRLWPVSADALEEMSSKSMAILFQADDLSEFALDRDWLQRESESPKWSIADRRRIRSVGRNAFPYWKPFWEAEFRSIRKTVPATLWRDLRMIWPDSSGSSRVQRDWLKILVEKNVDDLGCRNKVLRAIGVAASETQSVTARRGGPRGLYGIKRRSRSRS